MSRIRMTTERIGDPPEIDDNLPPNNISDDALSPSPPLLLQNEKDPLPSRTPDSKGTVRLVVVSDTHGGHSQLPHLPHGDVLLHLGDVADRGSLAHIRSFASYLKRQMRRYPIARLLIEGNHDRDRRHPDRINLKQEYADGAGYLIRDEVVELFDGRLRIMGVSWAACEQDDYSEALHNAGKDRIDILLTHRNPFYSRTAGHGWHGSKTITRKLVLEREIPLHLFGHVHWGRGIKTGVGKHGGIMVNCSTIVGQPVVIDWDLDNRRVIMVHCPTPSRFSDIVVSPPN